MRRVVTVLLALFIGSAAGLMVEGCCSGDENSLPSLALHAGVFTWIEGDSKPGSIPVSDVSLSFSGQDGPVEVGYSSPSDGRQYVVQFQITDTWVGKAR